MHAYLLTPSSRFSLASIPPRHTLVAIRPTLLLEQTSLAPRRAQAHSPDIRGTLNSSADLQIRTALPQAAAPR